MHVDWSSGSNQNSKIIATMRGHSMAVIVAIQSKYGCRRGGCRRPVRGSHPGRPSWRRCWTVARSPPASWREPTECRPRPPARTSVACSTLGCWRSQAQGRHRYYRLVDERAANAFEALAALAPAGRCARCASPGSPPQLRLARTCYDHLAGAGRGAAGRPLSGERRPDRGSEHGFDLGDHGAEQLTVFGLDLDDAQSAPGALRAPPASTGASAASTWPARSARRCSAAWSSCSAG